jgi:hypothetical protein
MRKDQAWLEEVAGRGPAIDRRTVAKGVAWSVPVVIVATAAPAAAASQPPPVAVTSASASPKGQGGSVHFTVGFDNPSAATSLSITILPDDGWKPRPISLSVPAGQSTVTFAASRDKNMTNKNYTLSFMSNGVSVTSAVSWI